MRTRLRRLLVWLTCSTPDVFHSVARQVRRVGRPIDASRADSWLAHWLLVARMAHRRGDESGLRAAVDRMGDATVASLFLDVSGHVCRDIDEEAFAGELGRLQVAHILSDMRVELKGAAGEDERIAIRSRAHRRLARWSPMRRRIHRIIVLGSDGASLGCGRGAADALAAHWGPAFSKSRGISPAAARSCLQFAYTGSTSSARLPSMSIGAVLARMAYRTTRG